jgi:hypothetical protein
MLRERQKGKVLRCERNYSPMNFNGPLSLMLLYLTCFGVCLNYVYLEAI